MKTISMFIKRHYQLHKTALAALFILTTLQVKGQYFVSESSLWSYANFSDPCSNKPDKYYWFKFEGDTTINSRVYNKLLRSGDSEMQQWELAGFFREDTLNHVYRYISNWPDEILVMDFSLEVGDSISLVYNPEHYVHVDSVVYKPFNFGENEVKHIYMNNLSLWIEGIGDRRGPLFNPFDDPFDPPLCMGSEATVCFFQNGSLLQHYENYASTCFITTNVKRYSANEHIKLYQGNGQSINIEINHEAQGYSTLKLYSYCGKKVLAESLLNNFTQISPIKPGLYIYIIESRNYKTQTGKVMVR